ncbi:MAG: PilZ domain-containing protein [Desulfobacterales bacterium]|nr:PilZ domain-containing protein [Desulfobacterales bacterium]MDJ0989834.1 PilZ domain-containing protein [Desulfobacterales bacterium]
MKTKYRNTSRDDDRRNASRMPYPTAMRYRSGTDAGLVKVVDISSHGMYFETPTPLTTGDRLCIDFRFRNSHAAMEICGEIARTTPSGAGVRFLW